MRNLPESNYRSRGGDYPRREPFFAMRIIRLMTKSAAAMEIGSDGVALVAIVAAQEDACRYTRPVNFWNNQLAPLIGVRGGDPDGLRRVRERCVRAGWLQYKPGNKRQPARYFVTIPAAVSVLPDGSSDESLQEYAAHAAPIQTRSCRDSAENLPGICQESAENPPPSSPSPLPNPIPGEGEKRTPASAGKPANAREALAKRLRQLGLPATAETVTEWADLCSGRAACTSPGNGLEFIAWAIDRAKADGVNLQFPRQAALYADQWAEKGAA